MGTYDDTVTMTKNTIMEGTHKDPNFMASVNIVAGQDSADKIDQLMENVEHHKKKMLKLKYSLVKT